jgi:hypothetical protein
MFGFGSPQPKVDHVFSCDACRKPGKSSFSCASCDAWVCVSCSTIVLVGGCGARRCDSCHKEKAELSKHARRVIGGEAGLPPGKFQRVTWEVLGAS